MSTTTDLIHAIKKELKAQQMTYADLAQELDMAESSVKRMLAKGDMPLSRIDAICRAMKMDFADLARRVADSQPLLQHLTAQQEQQLVADKKLLMVATCVISQWSIEQIVADYRITTAECIACFAQLDRIGIIELKPNNKYRLKIAKTFRWLPHGAVMTFFRENGVLDYFGGSFADENEGMLLVHGSVSRVAAPQYFERMQKIAADFAQQHQLDQKLDAKHRQEFTIVMALRDWELPAFEQMRRR